MGKNGVHWLRDDNMLQKTIPNARIMVYGYRSQWIGPDAVQMKLSSVADALLHAIHQDREQKGVSHMSMRVVYEHILTTYCSTANDPSYLWDTAWAVWSLQK